MFSDCFHPPGATYCKLGSIYRDRWVKSVLYEGYVPFLTYTACSNLKWLSTKVPARVHLANVRLHFNGWHTERRYQRKHSVCTFCKLHGSEDSLEHYFKCSFVNNRFPRDWKVAGSQTIEACKFVLLRLSDNEKIVMSVFNYALYNMSNFLRHVDARSDLNHTLYRIMGEVYLKPSVRKTFEDIFQRFPSSRSAGTNAGRVMAQDAPT
jgi:hypothetical protein